MSHNNQHTPKKSQNKAKILKLPEKSITTYELAKQHYKTSLPTLLRKLDKVSGNLNSLAQMQQGNSLLEWTQIEDKLIYTNEPLITRWKGKEKVEERRAYLEFQGEKGDENGKVQ